MQQVIGTETTYTGTEPRYLSGLRLKIVAVIKGAAGDNYNPDPQGTYITDDEDLAHAGGVEPMDRVEVLPWIARDRDWSFCSSDPRAADLAAFAGVGR